MSDFLKALQTGKNEATIYEDNHKKFITIINELADSLNEFFNSKNIEIVTRTDYIKPSEQHGVSAFITAFNPMLEKKESGFEQMLIRNKDTTDTTDSVEFLKYMLSSRVFPITVQTEESTIYCEASEDLKNVISDQLASGAIIRKLNNLINN